MSNDVIRFTYLEVQAINAAYLLRESLNRVEDWATQQDSEPYGKAHNLIMDLLLTRYGLEFAKAVDNQMIESGLTDVCVAIRHEAEKALDR